MSLANSARKNDHTCKQIQEGGKKEFEASKVKQITTTQHTQGSHFS